MLRQIARQYATLRNVVVAMTLTALACFVRSAFCNVLVGWSTGLSEILNTVSKVAREDGRLTPNSSTVAKSAIKNLFISITKRSFIAEVTATASLDLIHFALQPIRVTTDMLAHSVNSFEEFITLHVVEHYRWKKCSLKPTTKRMSISHCPGSSETSLWSIVGSC